MAEPITQARLRALAAVHPDEGRVLSVFLNLDPTEFATPSARSSAITSVMTAAAHKVEAKDGLTHDERMALRDDVERVRDVLAAPTSPPTARAPWPSTRAGRPTCSRSSACAGRSRTRSCSTAPRSSSRSSCTAPTSAGWCCSTNRRAARLFVGPGDALEETDRLVDDVHSAAREGRLVAVQLPALGREGGPGPPRPTPPSSRSTSTRSAGWTAC